MLSFIAEVSLATESGWLLRSAPASGAPAVCELGLRRDEMVFQTYRSLIVGGIDRLPGKIGDDIRVGMSTVAGRAVNKSRWLEVLCIAGYP